MNATVNFEFKKHFLTYSQVYTDQVWLDSRNDTYLPYSSPASLEVGRKFAFKSSFAMLSFRVNNLYNEEYQYVAHMPMPLRNYTINFIYQFNKSQ